MNNYYGSYGPPPQQPGDGQPYPQGGQPYPQGHFHQPGVAPRTTQSAGAAQTQPRKQGWFSRHPVLSAGLTIAAVLIVATVARPGQDGTSTTGATPPDQPTAAAPATSDPDDSTAGNTSAEPSDTPSEEPTEEPSEEADLAFGIGDAARTGDFEFVVDDLETGVESIGNDFLNEQAQGQYALVGISVTNIGSEAVTFYDGDQILIDTEGREHSPDSGAFMYLEEDEGLFLTEINPGNTAVGTLVFDIPTDATPATIILCDASWFSSDEVEISLQ